MENIAEESRKRKSMDVEHPKGRKSARLSMPVKTLPAIGEAEGPEASVENDAPKQDEKKRQRNSRFQNRITQRRRTHYPKEDLNVISEDPDDKEEDEEYNKKIEEKTEEKEAEEPEPVGKEKIVEERTEEKYSNAPEPTETTEEKKEIEEDDKDQDVITVED